MKQMWIGSVVACVMLVANAAAYTSTEPQMKADQAVPSGETVLGTGQNPAGRDRRRKTTSGRNLHAASHGADRSATGAGT